MKFWIYPRNKGREMFKLEGMIENLIKNIAFSVFLSEMVFWVRMVKWEGGGIRTVQGNGKYPSKPWKIKYFFRVLSPILPFGPP